MELVSFYTPNSSIATDRILRAVEGCSRPINNTSRSLMYVRYNTQFISGVEIKLRNNNTLLYIDANITLFYDTKLYYTMYIIGYACMFIINIPKYLIFITSYSMSMEDERPKYLVYLTTNTHGRNTIETIKILKSLQNLMFIEIDRSCDVTNIYSGYILYSYNRYFALNK
jgi:hypothetical protein